MLTSWLRRWEWLAVLCACSGARSSGPAPPTAARVASVATPAATPAEPASCPPVGSGNCRIGDACTHGNVTCTCEREPWCKGAAPTEAEENATTWDCVGPPVPGACPHDEPRGGTACAVEGQKCDYSCGCIRGTTCTGGVWTTYRGDCRK